jgi:acyl dehydratase
MVDFGGPRMIEVGTVIEERIFTVNRALLKEYADASGDQNPIHQNEEFALSVGLPNVIAHGMLTMALVGKFVTDWAGGSSKVNHFGARFIKPVIVPADTDVDLTVTGTVTEVTDRTISIDLTATSAGTKVLGMATAIVQR